MTDNETKNTVEILVDNFGVKQIIEMFDLMPDILFWIKDIEGRFVYANKFFLENMGLNHLNQVVGYTDFDLSPSHIAKQFYVDDQKVLSGQVVHNRHEMNIDQYGNISWFTTSKRVLLNEHQEVVGSYGISRHLEKTSHALIGMDALKAPIEFVRNHYMEEITMAKLAGISHLSISALERRFKKFLNKTPKQFINEVRLENARQLLVESSLPIAIIANDVGFSDHSYFSKQFSLLFGQLPSAFRKEHNSPN